MEHGLIARIIDRAIAKARVIRGTAEVIALVGIIILAVCYFTLQRFHRERVAALNDRIAAQERVLADYRTKLKGAAPDEAATQIETLANLLAETQNSLSVAKSEPGFVENQSRDPRRLYEDNNPIALTRDPKIDLDGRKITFPVVNAAMILGINKV